MAHQRARVAAVIPAYNEQENVAHAVHTMQRVAAVDDVVVVDGHSTDATARRAQQAGARVIRQARRVYPGKGVAIQTAVSEVDAEILVFFDADIRNMRPEMVDRLVQPVLTGQADHAIATYQREAGRVTELTARPLLKLLFPEIDLRQPLAGEFATRRDVLAQLDLEPHWGVESAMVVDLFMQNRRVVEVDLGRKEHDMKELRDLRPMALQVSQTILERAERYGRLRRAVPRVLVPA